MENEQYIESGLSVGTTKIANKYEIFTEEEVDIINNKIPELDERVTIIEYEIEENIQQQINNLVLGAVGDGNNAEVVQARGPFSTLNDRLDNIDEIKDNIKVVEQHLKLSNITIGKVYFNGDNYCNIGDANDYKIWNPIKLKKGTYYYSNISLEFTSLKKSDTEYVKLKKLVGNANDDCNHRGQFTVDFNFDLYVSTFKDAECSMISAYPLPDNYTEGYKSIFDIQEDTLKNRLSSVDDKVEKNTFENIINEVKNNITNVSKSMYIKDEKREIISLNDFENGKYYSLWENEISTPSNDGYCIAQPIEIESGIYTFKSISTVFSFIKVDGVFISLKEFLGDYGLGKVTFAYLPTSELYITTLISENNYIYQGKPTVYNYLNTDIHVAQDLLKDVPNIKLAINMIVDNSIEWNILIHKGIYYENSLDLPNNVNLINPSGDYNDVEIRGELDNSSSSADITNKSTIDLHWSNRIENIKVTARNLRYPIHSESGGKNKDWKQIIKNCYLEHYGNPSPNSQWTSYHAWGEGASSGAYAYFEDCYFKSPTEPWYIHEALNQEKPYIHELKNCVMECTDYAYGRACVIDNTRENTVTNVVKFEDCTFVGSLNVNGTFPMNVELKNCGDVLINCDNNGNKFSKIHYPIEKNRIRKAIYKGSTPLVGGEVIASGDVFGQVKLAESSTPVEKIVGIVLGSANPEDLITIITGGIFYCDRGWSGNKISAGDNGTISENGSNVFAIGLGFNYARLLNK